MPGNRRGKCRIEYFAMAAEINQLAAKGWLWRHIYDHLKAEAKITMSYCTFWRYVRSKPKTGLAGSPIALAPTPRIQSREFIHNKLVEDESSLI